MLITGDVYAINTGYPSKHETLAQRWTTVGPSSTMLAQHDER